MDSAGIELIQFDHVTSGDDFPDTDIHWAVDIETLATTNDAAVFHFAAVPFSPSRQVIYVGSVVEQMINPEVYQPTMATELLAREFAVDPNTVEWWNHTDRAGQFAQYRRLPPGDSIRQFIKNISQLCLENGFYNEFRNNEAVWVNGASFDFPILDHMFNVAEMESPIHYRNRSCVRTLWKYFLASRTRAEKEIAFHESLYEHIKTQLPGQPHDAVFDAYCNAVKVIIASVCTEPLNRTQLLWKLANV